jgi:hypothetical protein
VNAPTSAELIDVLPGEYIVKSFDIPVIVMSVKSVRINLTMVDTGNRGVIH